MDKALHILMLLSLGGTAMALVLMLMRRVMKGRLPSTVYYYAWLLVLLRLVTPLPGLLPVEAEPAVSPVTQTGSGPQTQPALWTASQRLWMDNEEEAGFVPVGEETDESSEVLSAAPAEGAVSAVLSAEKEPLTLKEITAAAADILTASGFWLGVWGLGAIVFAARYVIGYRRFTRALEKTLRPARESDQRIYALVSLGRKPRLVRSRCVTTPMLLGLFRPTLVLPDWEYSPLMLENILRHELTHYHRGDLAYKWFAMGVFSLHWFNPLMGLFRRELDRACELSCDERILRGMTTGEKQNYGETLLTLAADRSLPKSVVATTFATEKRTLKERLEQIMTYKHRGKAGLALALAAMLLLGGCGAVLGPEAAEIQQPNTIQAEPLSLQPTPEPGAGEPEAVQVEPSAGGETLTVSTVDELLAAIAPNNTIYLEPGEYILSQASDYGQSRQGGWYTWTAEYTEGYQLNITGVENLSIVGGGEATICTEPRGVEVLAFIGCQGIDLSGTVVGHTEYPAMCTGGVLYFESTDDVTVTDCCLYGCGTWGITAINSRNVYARDTEIYDCSYGAIQAENCYDFRFIGGAVYDCAEYSCDTLFDFSNCYGAAIVNTEVFDNENQFLLNSQYSQEVYLLGNRVEENDFTVAMIKAYPYNVVVDGCSFRDNGDAGFYGQRDWELEAVAAVSPAGAELDEAELAAMTLAEASYDGPKPLETVSIDKTVNADGITEVYVTNVDEFLAAIGPDTIIHMAEGEYDLSQAGTYGFYGGQYYYWTGTMDGPGLVITGVENLQILGAGKDSVEILAVPRFVEVITFNACDNITLAGVTAGHTPINESTCSGGVVKFQDCVGGLVKECGLFGCGTYGVTTMRSADIQVLDTEIYECSVGGASIMSSINISFDNCDIHDCANNNAIQIYDSANVTRDGVEIL